MSIQLGRANNALIRRENIARMIVAAVKSSTSPVERYAGFRVTCMDTNYGGLVDKLDQQMVPWPTVQRIISLCHKAFHQDHVETYPEDYARFWCLAFLLPDESTLAAEWKKVLLISDFLPLQTMMDKNQSNDSEISLAQCTVCGKQNARACLRCSPISAVVKTYYCNRLCQERDFDQHRKHCRLMGRQFQLKRIVSLMEVIWSHWKENVCNAGSITVLRKHGITYFIGEMTPKAEFTGTDYFELLDTSVFANDQEKRAYLNHLACTEVCICFENLFFAMLRFEVVNLTCGKLRSAFVTILHGQHIRPQSYGHTVLRATLGPNCAYAVDLTCVQYGWNEVLVPWKQFLSTRQAIERAAHPSIRADAVAQELFREDYYMHRQTILSRFAKQIDALLFDKDSSKMASNFLTCKDNDFSTNLANFDSRVGTIVVAAVEHIRKQKMYQRYIELGGSTVWIGVTNSKQDVQKRQQSWLSEEEWESCIRANMEVDMEKAHAIWLMKAQRVIQKPTKSSV